MMKYFHSWSGGKDSTEVRVPVKLEHFAVLGSFRDWLVITYGQFFGVARKLKTVKVLLCGISHGETA